MKEVNVNSVNQCLNKTLIFVIDLKSSKATVQEKSKECMNNEVDVDSIQIEQNHTFMDVMQKLPKYRKEKILKLRNQQDKLRSLAAGVLLNYAVQCYQGNVPVNNKNELLYVDLINDCIANYDTSYDYQVGVGQDQKPFFVDDSKLFYNLSHAGRYVCCVIGPKNCGIDIEGHRTVRPELLKRVLTETEYEWVKKEQEHHFFQLWTLKEAYSKAEGRGIYKNFKSISFHPNSDGELECDRKELETEYQFRSFQLGDYWMSVVVQK